jgi:hypothetical protein
LGKSPEQQFIYENQMKWKTEEREREKSVLKGKKAFFFYLTFFLFSVFKLFCCYEQNSNHVT